MSYQPEDYISQLKTLVNIDSGDDSPEGLVRMLDFYETGLNRLHFKVDRISVDNGGPDYLVATNKKSCHYDILYIAHVDTAFEKGTCKKSPFHMEGSIAYGPGIADMKAGALALLHFLQELPAELLDSLSVCVLIHADEENYWKYTGALLPTYGARSDHVFVFEAAFPDGSHCIDRKGRLLYDIEFTGITAHSGYIYETRNASAILELSHWIEELNRLASREDGITFNAGIVSGGSAINLVPAKARLCFEFRMWEASELDVLEAQIQYLLQHPKIDGVAISVKEGIRKYPMHASRATLAFIDRIREQLEEQDSELDFNVRPRGGMSNANILAPHTPVCIDGLGPRGELDTGDDNLEAIDTASVAECLEINRILFEEVVRKKHGVALQCS